MAFDTENQRRSALNSAIRINLPVPDGSIDVGDSAMLLFQYAFDSFPAPPAITLDLFQPQIKNLKQSGQIDSEKQENQIKWVQ